MTVLIALDKFKGSLTTFQANTIVSSAINKVIPTAVVHSFPMADGGDGFSDVLQYYSQTKKVEVPTVNALHLPIISNYQWDNKELVAFIEVAKASGMQQLPKHQLNPLQTSTYGTGLLIKHALDKGAKKIILGLGGSATNDGGIGILSALGFKFFDVFGNILEPNGSNLLAIKSIHEPKTGIPKVEFVLACDVNNELYGENGAAFVYAAQKGASKDDIVYLDKGLQSLSNLLVSLGLDDFSKTKGCGAAGGIPLGILSFFDATIEKGIDLVIRQSNILNVAAKADLLITGEGKIDNQSMHGKVIASIADIAKFHAKPCLAYCGIDTSKKDLQDVFKAIYAIKNDTMSEDYAVENASVLLLKKVMDTIGEHII